MKVTNEQREQAKAKLREWLPPGSTVWTVLRHVSSSGMTRDISPVIVVDGKPADISYWVNQLGIGTQGRNGGVRLGGAGMDMGFHLVYSLSYSLYQGGFDCLTHEPGESVGDYDADGNLKGMVVQLGERRADAPEYGGCPANDHSNRNPVYHHSDGGYALKHEWL